MKYLRKHRAVTLVLYIISVLLFFYIYRNIIIILPDKISTPRIALESGNFAMYLLLRLMNIMAGIMLALPGFCRELSKGGRLKYDLLRCLIWGLPALVISSGLAFDLLFIDGVSRTIGKLGSFLAWISYDFPRYFFEIFVGYHLLGCLKKTDGSI